MGQVKNSYLNEKYTPFYDFEKPENSRYVSFSQFQTFSKCPRHWKLLNIDRLRQFTDTINTIFGEAMHQTIQTWIRTISLQSVKASDELDLNAMLLENLKQCYVACASRYGDNFCTKEELSEFYTDGVAGLNWLKKNRKRWFIPRDTDLFGIEVPILHQVDANYPSVLINGYLDFVLIDKTDGKVTIFDIKTSKRGWTKYDKEDFIKTSQLILYKIFFSRQYNVPIDKINVEFIILKRKIDESSMYPQKYASSFVPSHGNITQNKVIKLFDDFLKSCFLPNGTFNTLYNYPAISGKDGNNCRFCEFKDDMNNCPVQQRQFQ
jgi:hypothetical protein